MGRGRPPERNDDRPHLTYLFVFPHVCRTGGTGACRLSLPSAGRFERSANLARPFTLAQRRPGALGHVIRAADSPPCGASARRTAQTVLTSLHPSDLFLETTFIDGPLREELADVPALTGYRERHERAAASSLEEQRTDHCPVHERARSTRRSSITGGDSAVIPDARGALAKACNVCQTFIPIHFYSHIHSPHVGI